MTIIGGSATYTPEAGFSGNDHFTYVAKDSTSEFPRHPFEASATVTVGAGSPKPEVTITGAPSGVTVGTTATLTAKASDDSSGIVWSTTAGSIKSEASGETATLQAPLSPEEIKVTAALRDGKASATREIAVTAQAPQEPAPSVPETDREVRAAWQAPRTRGASRTLGRCCSAAGS